jgi:hypothetical protein
MAPRFELPTPHPPFAAGRATLRASECLAVEAPHQENSALKVHGDLKRQFAAYPHSYPHIFYEFIP